MIGSTGRNTGKTALAAIIIEHLKRAGNTVCALKVTTVKKSGRLCTHGGAGCGACDLDGAEFVIYEETDPDNKKDTGKLLKSGAEKVLWLRSLSTALKKAYNITRAMFPNNAYIVCESNSLRNAVIPGLFIMIEDAGAVKESARETSGYAQIKLRFPWEHAEANDVLNAVNQL